ncbi:hypothetical protein HXZ66_01765 [Bacillus sp. A116_S68]|nr:hypothetical protein HXZ66_01765 [Bacillus sp. A116_S68]
MKNALLGFIVFFAVFSFFTPGLASFDNEQVIKVTDKNDSIINVTIEKEVSEEIDDDIIQMVVDQSADMEEFSNSIIIHNVDLGDLEEEEEHLFNLMGTNVTKIFKQRVNGPAKFLTSVARGQTKKLGEKITVTNSKKFGVKGGVKLPSQVSAEVSGSIGKTKTKTYNKTVTFSGPPSKSSAYSRNFYNTPFSDTGTWKAVYKPLIGSSKTYQGTYNEPSKQDPFIEWSRDIKK